jgi:hypothetical protein
MIAEDFCAKKGKSNANGAKAKVNIGIKLYSFFFNA